MVSLALQYPPTGIKMFVLDGTPDDDPHAGYLARVAAVLPHPVRLIDRTDLEGLYQSGTEVLTWTTPEELSELCKRAVADTTWTDTIREAARARTLAEHTFDHRVAVLEDSWDTA